MTCKVYPRNARFNILIATSIFQHANRVKKSHMIISVGTEKASDKILHLFMI